MNAEALQPVLLSLAMDRSIDALKIGLLLIVSLEDVTPGVTLHKIRREQSL